MPAMLLTNNSPTSPSAFLSLSDKHVNHDTAPEIPLQEKTCTADLYYAHVTVELQDILIVLLNPQITIFVLIIIC